MKFDGHDVDCLYKGFEIEPYVYVQAVTTTGRYVGTVSEIVRMHTSTSDNVIS
jgi:hypothetical protein